MAQIKQIFDQYGILYEANKVLPDDKHKLQLMEVLAELEDNANHVSRSFPKSRLHRVKGYEKAVYRADIDKTSGWRIHLQYNDKTGQLWLKDIIAGKFHDDVIDVIKSKKIRYD